jgi:hypothetical protein
MNLVIPRNAPEVILAAHPHQIYSENNIDVNDNKIYRFQHGHAERLEAG